MLNQTNFHLTVLRVVAANRLYHSTMETQIHHRSRKRWAVALKAGGQTYYTVNGREILSDSLHPVLLPKGVSYSWRCTEPGECLIIEFDAAETAEDIFSFTIGDNSFFLNDFWTIRSELQSPSPDSTMGAIYRLYGLLLQLIGTGVKSYIPKEKQLRLKPALDFISEHYDIPDISNEQLAQLCGVSTVYFRKLFQSVYGVSPIRYLHDFRMKKAKDLLSSDFGSISQVAQSTGYSSVYHFSKMFRSYTGTSPSQYVKTAQKK